jgi:hypothetical protein
MNSEPIERRITRCAIYTRKSTEYGLDKAVNSLDAQREVCRAYIKCQAHRIGSKCRDGTTTAVTPAARSFGRR